MAGANRAARRRAEREHNKRIGKLGTPASAKPDSSHGVEVDRGEDGSVYLTLYGGYMTMSVKWSERDAVTVAEMIMKAAEGKADKGVEVVRESGIVVPPAGFQL